MSLISLKRRLMIAACASMAAMAVVPAANAQETPIKFQYDWRFDASSSLFLLPQSKGYFKAEGIDFTMDAGSGSGTAVTRVASGTYDMAFADLTSLMEFVGNNPTAPSKPVAVMVVYSSMPTAVISLKKTGIKTPADLNGKKLGSPVFDAGRRAFPIFAKANNVTNVAWTSMDPPLRETMLIRGDVDAITGFPFTSVLNLEARGVKAEDLDIMPYADYGVKLYGHAIIVSPEFLKKNPEKVKGFLRAFSKGMKDLVADPKAAVAVLKARDGVTDEALETRRLNMTLQAVVLTPSAKEQGFGSADPARVALMASQVSDAFNTKERIDATTIWNGSFLPSAADRNIFAAVKVAHKN